MNAADRSRRQKYTDEGTWTGARVKAAYRTGWRATFRVPVEKRTLEHANILNWPVYYLPALWAKERRAMQILGYAAVGEWRLADLIRTLINPKTGECVSRSTYEEWVRDAAECIAHKLNAPARARAAAAINTCEAA